VINLNHFKSFDNQSICNEGCYDDVVVVAVVNKTDEELKINFNNKICIFSFLAL
jgi:hypothetical protein